MKTVVVMVLTNRKVQKFIIKVLRALAEMSSNDLDNAGVDAVESALGLDKEG